MFASKNGTALIESMTGSATSTVGAKNHYATETITTISKVFSKSWSTKILRGSKLTVGISVRFPAGWCGIGLHFNGKISIYFSAYDSQVFKAVFKKYWYWLVLSKGGRVLMGKYIYLILFAVVMNLLPLIPYKKFKSEKLTIRIIIMASFSIGVIFGVLNVYF